MVAIHLLLAVGLLLLALGLLLHHLWIHSQDNEQSAAKRESVAALCYFQLHDISNHETWVAVCLTNAITLWFLVPVLCDCKL